MNTTTTRDLRTICNGSPATCTSPQGQNPDHPFIKNGTRPPKPLLLTVLTILLPLLLPLSGYGQTPCDCPNFITIGEDVQDTSYISSYGQHSDTCLLIKGTLIIDQGTIWTNIMAKMEEGSKILVNGSVSFNVLASYLSGCESMWWGIDLEDGYRPYFTCEESVIEDALIAILHRSGQVFHCTNTTFKNNYIGIAIGSPFGDIELVNRVSYAGLIHSNHFFTDPHLADPFPGMPYYPSWPQPEPGIPYNKGYAAIYVAGALGFNIGISGATEYQRNKIHNMRNGIVLVQSAVHITGTDIYDLEGSVPRQPGHPILSLNQNGIYAGTQSFVEIVDNTFVNLMVGIRTEHSYARIERNVFDIVSDIENPGLSATRGIIASFPQEHIITHNDITNGFAGIQLNDVFGPYTIDHNILHRDLELGKNTGIGIAHGRSLPDGAPGHIGINTLHITDASLATGISLTNVIGATVRSNNIYFYVDQEAGGFNTGIAVSGGNASNVSKNMITAAPSYKAEIGNNGILVSNSGGNSLSCNLIDNMHTLVKFVGLNTGTSLRKTQFHDGTVGLELMGPTMLGTQLHTYNEWLGEHDEENQYAEYGAFISGPNPVNTALGSRFIVNEAWTDPCVGIPCEIGPVVAENLWFFPDNGSGPFEICTVPPPLVEPDKDTLVALLQYYDFNLEDYEEETVWLMKAGIFELLLHFPDLRTHAALDSFFDAEENTNLGLLVQYQVELSSRFDIDQEGKDDAAGRIYDLMHDLVTIDSAQDISFNPSLATLRVLKVDTLSLEMAAWSGLIDSELSASADRYEELYNDIGMITPVNDLEEYLVTALKLRIKYLLGFELDGNDSLQLLAIISVCYLEGGSAISIAQGLYQILADENLTQEIHECPVSLPLMAPFHEVNSPVVRPGVITMYPNPVSDVLTIISPEVIRQADIMSAGMKLLDRSNPGAAVYRAQMSSLPPGLYFIYLHTDSGLHIEKLTILR